MTNYQWGARTLVSASQCSFLLMGNLFGKSCCWERENKDRELCDYKGYRRLMWWSSPPNRNLPTKQTVMPATSILCQCHSILITSLYCGKIHIRCAILTSWSTQFIGMLCNHHHCVFPRFFSSPQGEPLWPLSNMFPFPTCPFHPQQPLLSLWICLC